MMGEQVIARWKSRPYDGGEQVKCRASVWRDGRQFFATIECYGAGREIIGEYDSQAEAIMAAKEAALADATSDILWLPYREE